MSEWDAGIMVARRQLDGTELDADEARKAGLEFCINRPVVWVSDGRGNMTLRFFGNAISRAGDTILIKVSDQVGVRKWVRPNLSRPDVLRHYARKQIDVSEFSGFQFLLDLHGLDQENATVTFEIQAGDVTSGPVRMDVAALYREHRADLDQEADYRGVFSPLPPVRGRLDFAGGHRVEGWAQKVGTQEPVDVSLYVNGEFIAEQCADRFRHDLVLARVSDQGRHAFEFELEYLLQPGDEVRVEVSGVAEVNNSPLRVSD